MSPTKKIKAIGSKNKYGTKQKIAVFILFYLTIGLIFPAFKSITKIPAFYPAFALLLAYLIYYYPNIFHKNSVRFVYFLFLITVVFYYSGYYEYHFELSREFFRRILPFFLAAILIEFIIISANEKIINKLGEFALYIFIINAILSIIAEQAYPGATRNDLRDFPFWVQTYSFGIVYAVPFVIGIFISLYNGKKWKFFLILSILTLSVIMTGFFTATIFTLAIITIGLMIKWQIKKIFYLTFLLIGIFITLNFKNEILEFISTLNPMFESKVADLNQIISKSSDLREGLSILRAGVYEKSLYSFLNNLFLGVGKLDQVGGHSFWLDNLANFGILGTLPYILVLISLRNRALIFIPKKAKRIYHETFSILLLLMIFNPFYFLNFWVTIFAFIPAISRYLTNLKYNKRKHFKKRKQQIVFNR